MTTLTYLILSGCRRKDLRDASGRELLRVLGWWRRNRNERFSFSQVAKAGGGASCLESSTEEGNAGGRQVWGRGGMPYVLICICSGAQFKPHSFHSQEGNTGQTWKEGQLQIRNQLNLGKFNRSFFCWFIISPVPVVPSKGVRCWANYFSETIWGVEVRILGLRIIRRMKWASMCSWLWRGLSKWGYH